MFKINVESKDKPLLTMRTTRSPRLVKQYSLMKRYIQAHYLYSPVAFSLVLAICILASDSWNPKHPKNMATIVGGKGEFMLACHDESLKMSRVEIGRPAPGADDLKISLK